MKKYHNTSVVRWTNLITRFFALFLIQSSCGEVELKRQRRPNIETPPRESSESRTSLVEPFVRDKIAAANPVLQLDFSVFLGCPVDFEGLKDCCKSEIASSTVIMMNEISAEIPFDVEVSQSYFNIGFKKGKTKLSLKLVSFDPGS